MKLSNSLTLTLSVVLLASFSLPRVLADAHTKSGKANPSAPVKADADAVPALKLHLEAVVKDGTKYWLPAQLKAKKGDRIRLKLENHITGPNSIHGFRLKEFHIEELVDHQGKEVEFVADHTGSFKYDCHLHPGHVGGELIVEEK
jgi:hypothetical protein